MKYVARKIVATVGLCAASVMMASAAVADEWPFVAGEYWEVTGIDIKDGGSWKYANWLADEWRKNAEFAKSKGWIKDYMVLANVHNRADEPDIYLINIRDTIPTGAESEKRGKEFRDWKAKTIEKMVGESGNRAEYREVMSTSLLQVMNFRN